MSVDPQIARVVTYTVTGVAVLSTGYVWYRHREQPVDPDTLFTLGGVSVLVLLLGTYTLHGSADLPVVPEPMLALLNGTVGMVLLAVGAVVVAARVAVDIDARIEASSDAVGVAVGLSVVAVPAVLLAVPSPEPTLLLQPLLTGLVAGVAAVSYERSDSVWAPVVGFATWLVLSDSLMLTAIASFL